MIHNAAFYISDPSIIGSRMFDCFDEIRSYEALTEGDRATGFLLNMDWGVMKMNFMPDAELGPHLKGLEGFIRQQIVDPDSLVYTLARHHYIRMAIGCVIEADEESPEMVPFLFQFASSLNALTFFYDRLYDFSGEALASAREEYEEE